MPNIKDVARLAGVTPTTVSRVLNNRGYLSEDTKNKVYAAMKQLHYHPNQIARALLSKRSGIFAIVVPDSINPFFSELVKCVEQHCSKNSYRLILCNSLDKPDMEHKYLSILQEQNIDGLIICSHLLDISDYEQLPFPVVSFDRALSKETPLVASDNFYGGTIAAEHLYNKGCKNVLHISGPLDETFLLGHDRYRGFKEFCLHHDMTHEVFRTQNRFDFDYYYAFIEQQIGNRLREFDGSFCSNDLIAYALYVYASSHGIPVPRGLKIVGFDNSIFTRTLTAPKITTVEQNIPLIASSLVDSLILQQEKPAEKLLTVLEVKLVEGNTT